MKKACKHLIRVYEIDLNIISIGSINHISYFLVVGLGLPPSNALHTYNSKYFNWLRLMPSPFDPSITSQIRLGPCIPKQRGNIDCTQLKISTQNISK